MKKTVALGMSGGVDSSVAAFLLKKLGYNVLGLFMKNWEEEGACAAEKDFEDVARIAEELEIPYYKLNFAQEYRDSVFEEFLNAHKQGLTPNPDILCNKEIKFKVFFEKAMQLGADFVATGHYCRVDEKGRLFRGKDRNKDQSYFLHAVSQKALQKTLFPIGDLLKSEVRKIAKENNLLTADKKDSTGICFIGKRSFKPFLAQFLSPKKGTFQTLDKTVVGEHDGAMFYTIGQRKGLGLGGEGEAWYVVDKNMDENIVFVERGENHPALFRKTLRVKDLFWIADVPHLPLNATAKIRYRQEDTPCTLLPSQEVLFENAQRAVTPGQSIVFYQGELCLGGGLIM